MRPREARRVCGAGVRALLLQTGAARRAAGQATGRPRSAWETGKEGWKDSRMEEQEEEAEEVKGVAVAVVVLVVAVVVVEAGRAVSGIMKPWGHITTCRGEGVAEGLHHP